MRYPKRPDRPLATKWPRMVTYGAQASTERIKQCELHSQICVRIVMTTYNTGFDHAQVVTVSA